MTVSIYEANQMIARHNNSIDCFNAELKYVPRKGNKLQQFIRNQELTSAQDFYHRGMGILRQLRAKGYDVKLDTGTNKLYLR